MSLISLIYSLAYTVLDCLPVWILSFNLKASASESRSTQYGKNIHYGEKVVIDGVGRQYRFHVVRDINKMRYRGRVIPKGGLLESQHESVCE